MAFEKVVPVWNAAGTEPPDTLKNTGFEVGYKPPASYFNWFWHGVSAALTELQGMSPRNINAMAETAVYYSSATEVDIDTATQSLLLVDKKWSKDCPLCSDSAFIFIMQLFFGDPAKSTSRTQIAFSYGDGGNRAPKGIALRCYFNGAWSDWSEMYGPHNKPTYDEIGGTIPSDDLPVIPIAKGGTGAIGWQQALTNLRAMERQAMYYSSTYKPDIDKLTDSLMLVPIEYSKDCPVGGGFVYIMQVFYASTDASGNRTQIAFPYMSDAIVGKGIAVRSCYNGTWSEWNELASTYNHRIKTYTSLTEIGLTAGSETIDSIVQALDEKSELVCATGEGNAAIYPDTYGMLKVTCIDSSRVRFSWTSKSIGIDYIGIYSASNTNKWSGWKKVYNNAYPPTTFEVGAVAKSGDTMTGALYAGSSAQTPGSYLVRNQKLSATEETPTVNGQICWLYE